MQPHFLTHIRRAIPFPSIPHDDIGLLPLQMVLPQKSNFIKVNKAPKRYSSAQLTNIIHNMEKSLHRTAIFDLGKIVDLTKRYTEIEELFKKDKLLYMTWKKAIKEGRTTKGHPGLYRFMIDLERSYMYPEDGSIRQFENINPEHFWSGIMASHAWFNLPENASSEISRQIEHIRTSEGWNLADGLTISNFMGKRDRLGMKIPGSRSNPAHWGCDHVEVWRKDDSKDEYVLIFVQDKIKVKSNELAIDIQKVNDIARNFKAFGSSRRGFSQNLPNEDRNRLYLTKGKRNILELINNGHVTEIFGELRVENWKHDPTGKILGEFSTVCFIWKPPAQTLEDALLEMKKFGSRWQQKLARQQLGIFRKLELAYQSNNIPLIRPMLSQFYWHRSLNTISIPLVSRMIRHLAKLEKNLMNELKCYLSGLNGKSKSSAASNYQELLKEAKTLSGLRDQLLDV